jgi:hypothetical protein
MARTARERYGELSDIRKGYLKTLPEDYTGPRHVVTVRQIPPEEIAPPERDDNWFEWEDRPGPEPVSNAIGPDDELVIQHYVVGKPMG